jgi:hypothetical protein
MVNFNKYIKKWIEKNTFEYYYKISMTQGYFKKGLEENASIRKN